VLCVYLLQILDIDDPVIANCLIDQFHVERVLLTEDHDDATDLMLNNPPRDYREVYAMDGKEFSRLTSWPCFRSYCIDGPPKVRYISANVEDVIDDGRHRCDKLREELRVKSAQRAQFETEAQLKTQVNLKQRF